MYEYHRSFVETLTSIVTLNKYWKVHALGSLPIYSVERPPLRFNIEKCINGLLSSI